MSEIHEVARNLYERLSPAVASIETKHAEGDISIGTCFHVGDNAWVTARHVVESREVLGIGQHRRSGEPAMAAGWRGPFVHPNPMIDVAVIGVEGLDAPVIDLGGHLDDWFGEEFLLWPIMVMGYPPIPHARGPLPGCLYGRSKCDR